MALEQQSIRVRRGGLDSRGERIRKHPKLGHVDIVIERGPGRGEGISLDWKAAKEFARMLREPLRALQQGMRNPIAVFHLGNGAVLVERAGKAWFAIKPDPFQPEQLERERVRRERDHLADQITNVAALAEQDLPEMSERTSVDQAMLARAGFGLGLTRDRQILAAAAHEHDTNDKLRRYMPMSKIGATVALPLPGVRRGSPVPAVAAREAAAAMSADELRVFARALEQRAREAS